MTAEDITGSRLQTPEQRYKQALAEAQIEGEMRAMRIMSDVLTEAGVPYTDISAIILETVRRIGDEKAAAAK
jgi:hypothetical protein